MGICSYERYWITCDGEGCDDRIEPDECETQIYAESCAEDDGWKEIGNQWLCPGCAAKKAKG